MLTLATIFTLFFVMGHYVLFFARNKLTSLYKSPHISSKWMFARPLPTALVLLFILPALLGVSRHVEPIVPNDGAVVFPIEVYPDDGTSTHVESKTFNVSNATGVDSIYVQAHQPFYHIGGNLTQSVANGFDAEGAAEIRINGGSWVEIRDQNVDCAYPERKYECVAGPYATIRFTIPANASGSLTDGANTVDFKFNGTDGIRSGYRVVSFGFMTPGDPSVQDFDPFHHGAHDASGFRIGYGDEGPPSGYGNASDIRAGETLWNSESTLDELNGQPMRASCGMCHARDGRDLKYFRYSNRTIASRSRAHGLSEKEGKQIAAYIRSVDLRKENGQTYDPPGTPYGPPYQPGHGFGPNKDQSPDDVDQVYWAAGAGLNWVLDFEREGRNGPDRRRDMMANIFPRGGNPANGVARTADGSLDWTSITMDKDLNMRELPINIMLPDWNNWLPDIHPVDADDDRFIGSDAEAHYNNNIRDGMSGSLSNKAKTLQDLFGEVDSPQNNNDKLMNMSYGSHSTEFEGATAQQSVYQWTLVKTWEALHIEHLEDKADDVYTGGSQGYDEPRGWPTGKARVVFENGPHVADNKNSPGNPDPYSYYGSTENDFFYTHVWYHLQLILMPRGEESSSGQAPTDWGYQDIYLHGTCGNYGISCVLREASSFIKQWQTASNGYGADGLGNDFNRDSYHNLKMRRGWNAHTADPDRVFAWAPGSFRGDGAARALPLDERTDLVEAMLRAWWDYVQDIPIVDFPQGEGSSVKFYPAPSDAPSFEGGWGLKNHNRKLYRGLYDVANGLPGVSPGLLDSLAAWGDAMWPDDQVDNTIDISGTVAAQNNPNPKANSGWRNSLRWHDVVANATGDGGGGSGGGGDAGNPPIRVGAATATDGELFGDGAEIPSGASVEMRCRGEDDDGAGLTQVDFEINGSTIHTDDSPSQDNPISTHTFSPADGEVTVQCTVHDNEGQTKSDAYSFMVVDQGGTEPPSDAVQELRLPEGWSLISSQVVPDMADLGQLFEAVVDDLVLLKNEKGDVYAPAYGINEVGTWNHHESYMVYMEKEHTLTVEGRALSSDEMSIELQAGWNLVPYLLDAPLPVQEAFASLEEALVVVEDGTGRSYSPARDENDLESLEPGKGYKVYVSESAVLTYPVAF